jgi:hypothetical protein
MHNRDSDGSGGAGDELGKARGRIDFNKLGALDVVYGREARVAQEPLQ